MVTHILGFPRIGLKREMKQAVESYWRGELDQLALEQIGAELRKHNWAMQRSGGLDLVTVGDFCWYDQVLDMSLLLGAIPERFVTLNNNSSLLNTQFCMARGRAPTVPDAVPCEMTKWFDTNYHYIVPEFSRDQQFKLSCDKLFDEISEAKALGHAVKPVLLGPMSYLWLGKTAGDEFSKLELLEKLLPVYAEIIQKISDLGVEWLQLDEPILALDLPLEWRRQFEASYHKFINHNIKILLTTYFGPIDHNLTVIANLPVEGIHLDLVSSKGQLARVIDRLSAYKVISCGVIDGRNIWRSNLAELLSEFEPIYSNMQDRLWLASSCSLLHVTLDLALETELNPEIKQWLAFAVQKIEEIVHLQRGLQAGRGSIETFLAASDAAATARSSSDLIYNASVAKRVQAVQSQPMPSRAAEYQERAEAQRQKLALPLFPTTTIGSFPQTAAIRQVRRDYQQGKITAKEYESLMRNEIATVISFQEEIGMDVLVHGEPERKDMVESFGNSLTGFVMTKHAWVQSYGSRCVKPPIIYGDVARKHPMTVEWIKYAQSLTKLPVKGMLTGAVTMLCWSFVREDQPLADTALQIALALQDEVLDLEKAGISIIQIDEPAFREGLPLLKENRAEYFAWAIKAFRVITMKLKNSTQVHSHMCYSEFNEIIDTIAELDADVISIEASRSNMELLSAFEDFAYPNEIGPGIYDIHSPQVAQKEIMQQLLDKAAQKIPKERLWVNPDCGLKTRDWQEVTASLKNMVDVARKMRQLSGGQGHEG